MKRIQRLSFIIIALILLPTLAFASERSDTIQAIQRQILPILKKYQIPGAAIVVYNHGQPYAFYYGHASLKKGDKVRNNTAFEIASISKVFTSALLAEEVLKGNVNLNMPMSLYIKNLPPANKNFSNVTMEDLATHVNGFGKMPGPKVHNKKQMIQSLKYWKPHQQAGIWWRYSNIGFGLLGYALEDATHMSYPELLKEDLTGPLHMDNTTIVGASCVNSNCAQGHGWTGLAVNTTKKLLIIPAAGSIRASGSDMLKFMGAAMDLPGTPPGIAQAMSLTETPIYQSKYGAQALGWEVHSIYSINKYGYLVNKPKYITLRSSRVHEMNEDVDTTNFFYDKTGSVAGFRSYVIVYPNEKTGIAVMVNRAMSRTQLVTATRRALLDLLA